MTAQIHDEVRYQNADFGLVGINGRGLFDPAESGFRPMALHTACWRGFYCLYSVEERLLLSELTINESAEAQPPPPFFETEGQWSDEHHGFRFEFTTAPIPFTGGLLLGRDFLDEMYLHMGFHPAYKFRNIHELIFEEGALVESSDRSQEMANFREDIRHRPLRPESFEDEDELKDWIMKTFRLDYQW